ncbi:response regulator [Mesorhizobium sp.]|uniref:response regulator n=1 Tax=Mesorhizobium sp. TaxID=1871066 RepID=UPI000FE6ED39|nr:response regulator [Mesorhizobium sp.]RWE65915.1 MAG: response regulator [Mesorhizobium sp.]TIW93746.1 MAG: response regulator [Mesorhizobium sp.]
MTDSLRVLVVEDEWLIAEDTAACLPALGYQVIGPAPSVAVALWLIDEHNVDVALPDIQLYGETSLAVARALQARDIPFAFLSGFGPGDVPSAFAGCQFLRKPADQVAILTAMNELVRAP